MTSPDRHSAHDDASRELATAGLTPLLTADQAAELLRVPASWLRRKATARAIPCTFIGKHLRFTTDNIAMIIEFGAHTPIEQRERRSTGQRRPQA